MLRRAVRALSNARRSCFNATPIWFYFGTQPLAIALLGRWILTNFQRLRGVQSPELRRSGVSQTSSGARGGIMYAQRCVVVGIMLTALGGGGTVSVGPDRVYPVDDVVGIMHSYEQGDQQQLPPALVFALNDKTARNNFITERMAAIDLEYSVYYGKLTNEAQLGNASADIIALLFSTGATGFASNVTKTALSAGATIANGVKGDINQDVLVAHTIQLLQSEMETSRSTIGARITANLSCSVPSYTVWPGLHALEDHYRAGTLPGALEALAATTGNNAQQTKNLKNGTNPQGQLVPSVRSFTARGALVRALAPPTPSAGSGAPACPSGA